MSTDKVSPGQKLKKPSARLRNTGIDVAAHWDRQGPWDNSTPPKHTPRNYSKVKARNVTGDDLRRGEVVEFTGFLLADGEGEIEQDYLWFEGDLPDETHVGWGITLQPIPAGDGETPEVGEIDWVLLMGACIAWVNITNEEHQYATRVAGEKVLQSAAKGPVKILHKPEPGEDSELPEERECVVQLMDESGEIKIVRPMTFIHAAWGGPSALYDRTTSGGDVETYGNYVHGQTNVRRKMYSGTCRIYDYDSYGDLSDTLEEIAVYNPGALPCFSRGTYIAQKFGDKWIITNPVDQFAHHRTHIQFSHYPGGSQTIQFGQTKFLDQTIVAISTGNFGTPSWEYTDTVVAGGYSDVFIRLPGAYKVTFGAEVWGAGAQTYTSTDSAGHTTTVNRHTRFELFLWKNFNPDNGTVATQGAANAEAGCWGTIPMDTSTTHQLSVERTVEIVGTLADWHGGPYTRLSLGIRAINMSGASASNALTWKRAWLIIEPCSNGREAGLYDGVGMNPFLGTGGTYQWWGGGPNPGNFDADGVWL